MVLTSSGVTKFLPVVTAHALAACISITADRGDAPSVTCRIVRLDRIICVMYRLTIFSIVTESTALRSWIKDSVTNTFFKQPNRVL